MSILKPLYLILCASSLIACSPNEYLSNEAWMAAQEKNAHPTYEPLLPPKPFVPATYSSAHLPDPFSNKKLLDALRASSTEDASVALVRPEQNRPKQALEAFPLDALNFVGTMRSQNKLIALIRTANAQIHQVKVGYYMGQDFGRIQQITENQITLREIAQETTGEWIERKKVVLLQEPSSMGNPNDPKP